jgi:sugar lactone lactonase YvrE
VIRKIVIETGEVTTYAGKAGEVGSVDGAVEVARFNFPRGLTSDGRGHLFVADTTNNTIRRIALDTGIVTTLAGKAGAPPDTTNGVGEVARFNFPVGLALDGQGNLFVADAFNYAVRQVVIATGEVTTLAGVPGQGGNVDRPDGTGEAARFRDVFGVAYDRRGNLFVADRANNTIRQVVIATGAVTTLAGSSTGSYESRDGTGVDAHFDAPQGLLYDGNGALLVADDSSIRKVEIASRAVTTVAGSSQMGIEDGTGASAHFGRLRGMALDGAGNLFVADLIYHTIREVAIDSHIVTTLAGSAGPFGSKDGTGMAARFDLPSGVTSDGRGNLFIADRNNDVIRQVVIASGTVTTLAGRAGDRNSDDGTGAAASFNFPYGIAGDGNGNLFVTDSNSNTIRQVMIATGEVSTIAGKVGQPLDSIDGTGDAARFNGPFGLAFEKGDLFVADLGNHEIRKVSIATRQVTTAAGAPVSIEPDGIRDGVGADARFYRPSDVATDERGSLFIVDGQTVRKMDIATGAVTTLAGKAGESGSVEGIGTDARFSDPGGIASDGKGRLYVSDTNNHVIRKIEVATGEVSTYAGTPEIGRIGPGPLPAELALPTALAVTKSGIAVLDGNSVLFIGP